MARKIDLDRGNDNLTMLIDLILDLSPNQVKMLYQELKARYTRRAHTKLYNELGEVDKVNGKVRLTEHQMKTLRVKYGDSYFFRALTEMTNYVKFLELHKDEAKYRSKLCQLNSRTHNKELESGGWVYEKCKSLICKQDDLKDIITSPYLIDDYSVARKYVESLPQQMRKMPYLLWLVEKFPELNDLLEE